MEFKNFWILLLIPFALGIVYIVKRKQKPASFQFSDTRLVADVPLSWKVRFLALPFILRLSILVLFIVALAGPRSVLEETVYKTEGIDIVLTIDASFSMAAEDFFDEGDRINRLEIVKKVVEDFIDHRPHDRLGLVIFGVQAYTACPLTSDHSWLKENLKRVDLGVVDGRGTAVGSAIASSVARLKSSKAKSKAMILLTDGVNNAGELDPIAAARLAEALHFKIYTIGAGTKGMVPVPVRDAIGRELRDAFGRKVYDQAFVDLDEETLKSVAQMTGGRYFRASDTESLKEVYQQIDTLEKVQIEQYGYRQYKELFPVFLSMALGILLLEILLANTVFLKIP